MNVVSVHEHDHYCRIVVGRDGHSVSKYVRLGDLGMFISSLTRACREADRDISMKTHGDLMHCEDSKLNRQSKQ